MTDIKAPSSGQVIYEARKAARMTQRQLATIANTSNQQIGRLERGERSLTKEWAERVGPALGLSASQILFPESCIESVGNSCLSKNIRDLRKKYEMTQGGLASLLGTNQATVSRWESQQQLPALPSLRDMAILSGVSLEKFAFGSPGNTSTFIVPQGDTQVGGQAFPHGSPEQGGATGMTLRDYFAGHALTAMLTTECGSDADKQDVADQAYFYADAMLKARSQS